MRWESRAAGPNRSLKIEEHFLLSIAIIGKAASTLAVRAIYRQNPSNLRPLSNGINRRACRPGEPVQYEK